jgi:hypothetical protein
MPQPDYENDLVFPPQEVKSQHELSEQARDTTVLISALEKCEKLEIQLNIVLNILLRECPQYEGYVRANFPHYFEELDKCHLS